MVSTSGLELAVSGPSAATGQVVLRASDGESSLDTAPAGLTAIVVIAGHTLVGEIVAVRSHLERVSRLVALASSPPPRNRFLLLVFQPVSVLSDLGVLLTLP